MDARSDEKESQFYASLFNYPWLSSKKRARLLHTSTRVIGRLARNGGAETLKRIRVDLILKYRAKHPSESNREIALRLGAPTVIISTLLVEAGAIPPPARRACKKNTVKNKPVKAPSYENGQEHDERMYKRVCLRPSWYVEDVLKRGYCGVVLPELEFDRYLDLYIRRRRGAFGQNCRVQ